jgi:hypothetical protein
MALNKDPIFGKTQKTAYCAVDSVNAVAASDLDDTPTNTVQLLAVGATSAAMVTKVTALPVVTVVATQLNLFLSKDGGTTKRLIDSQSAAAYTYATTTAPTKTTFDASESAPIRLGAGDSLWAQARCATPVTAGWIFKAEHTELEDV